MRTDLQGRLGVGKERTSCASHVEKGAMRRRRFVLPLCFDHDRRQVGTNSWVLGFWVIFVLEVCCIRFLYFASTLKPYCHRSSEQAGITHHQHMLHTDIASLSEGASANDTANTRHVLTGTGCCQDASNSFSMISRRGSDGPEDCFPLNLLRRL